MSLRNLFRRGPTWRENIKREIKELKQVSNDTLNEIAEIKTDFDNFKAAVKTRDDGLAKQIADLQAEIANGTDATAVKAALDDLKADLSRRR